jgi:hypothetical protein
MRRTVDSFSDKTTCVLTPKGNTTVQISRGALYIIYTNRGGLKGYEYRIDDAASSGMRLPSRAEERSGILEFTGQEFSAALTARRLRFQTLTFVGGIINEDINMAGANRLYDKMISACQA